MSDADKTKEQLIKELRKLRKTVAAMKNSAAKLKRSENQLKEAEERFRAITEATPDGIVAADSSGKVIYWNSGAEKITGYARREVLGKQVYFLSPDNQKHHERERVKQIKAGILPVSGKTHEYNWKRKDGSLLPAETSFASWKSGDRIFISAIFRDIARRKQNEEALRRYQHELEDLVKEQTDDLANTNEQLRKEIEGHKQAEEALRKREADLQEKSRHLEETNTALKVLLERREADKGELGENILHNVRELINPYLERLGKTRLDQNQKTLFGIIELNLNNIISPFMGKLSSKYFNLTPMEIKVAGLVKDGSTNQEIAELLCIALNTTLFHRHNIRRKLGVKNKKINLRSHLLSFEK
jgi:PAS domain S-box-containing protein